MADIAIRAEGLGKRYAVGALGPGFKTWREGAHDIATAPFRKAVARIRPRTGSHPSADAESRVIWAIRDVSFEVPFGRALGIIGHNGAGKSTLVKILSRITEPTEGRATVAGRVGSLLEVSAGFHPELTGRENVYLNGAVLGMTRLDIRRRFDEIVEFAQVERYLDTPVKYYSSGMSMRLAFAVAAHLEPEVLVVDEVLAVGDSGFHKKCLDKMTESVSAGRTVLFISHNLAAVTQLCTQGLLLQRGRVIGQGSASEMVAKYLATGRVAEGRSLIAAGEGDQESAFRFRAVSAGPIGKEPAAQIDRDEGVEVTIEYDVTRRIENLQINLELWNYDGVCALSTGIRDRNPGARRIEGPGSHLAACRIPSEFLRAGMYTVSLEAMDPEAGQLDVAPQALTFEVVDLSSPEAKILESPNGAVRPLLEWSEQQGDEAARSSA